MTDHLGRTRTARDIGLIIRQRRKKLGWPQQRLADEVGAGRQWVSDVERGKARAEIGLVLRVLRVFGLEVRITPEAGATEHSAGSRPAGLDLDEWLGGILGESE